MRSAENEELVQKLKGVMEEFGEVQLAYLFGSYAEGRAMPISDLDIAILTRERRVIPYLTARISKVLGILEERISVLDLEDASSMLKLRILRRGVKLLDGEAYEERLRKEIAPEAVDLLENERADFHSWLRGDPIDESIIKRILAQLSEDVDDLEEFLKKRPEEIKPDRNLSKAFERTMQTSIEGAIDLLRHVMSGLNLGVAESYKDYVEVCREKGVITAETAERLLELIPTRHSLVHRYREIDYSRLWLDAKKVVDTVPRLQDEVKHYLQKAIERSRRLKTNFT